MRANRWKLQYTIPAAITVLVAVLLTSIAVAQSSPFSSELTKGPYRAGFETIERFDYSRVFRDRYDYDGNPREGETARPIQICVWYPAVENDDAQPTVYGEYAFPAPGDSRFYPFVSALQGRELGFLMTLFGGNRTLLMDMMNLPVAAFKNAGRAEGSFPVIIYHPDGHGSFAENAAMCEVLASNGFIVATSHAFGATDIEVNRNLADLEAMVRDREFVFGFMRDYPHADPAHVAVMGTGLGGLSAMLMQMRNADIEAVAVINGAQASKSGAELATGFPFFEITRMDVPLLEMYISDDDSLDTEILDSLIYSQRMWFGMAGRGLIDFTQYATAAALLADTTGELVQPASRFYGAICGAIVDFFEMFLKGESSATTIFADFSKEKYPNFGEVTFGSYEGQKPPPTEAQFLEMIQQDRVDRAIEIYEAFKKSRPGYVFFQEATLNVAGYRLLQANQLERACMIFKMNTEAYPNSANVWDSYADGCIANGDNQTAIMCYEKVLEVLPQDSAAGPGVREILLNNATQGLEQLRK